MDVETHAQVEAVARAAAAAAPALARADPAALDAVLGAMAGALRAEAGVILAANAADVRAAEGTLSGAVLDRLRLDEGRLEDMARQVEDLAALPPVPTEARELGARNGVRVAERRVPVGVIGANYEARANVTLDVASQLVKSRNGGVLRTGGAALGTASALIDAVVAPALRRVRPAAGGHRAGAHARPRGRPRALLACPVLVPLVILRGSGPTHARAGRRGRGARGAHPGPRRGRRRALRAPERGPGRGRWHWSRPASTAWGSATASTCS